METLADRVTAARIERGWDQVELAAHASMHAGKTVSKQTINQIELGRSRQPQLDTIAGLVGALGVTQQWLLTGRGPKHPEDGDRNRVREAPSPQRVSSREIPNGYVRLTVLDGEASGGSGAMNNDFPEVVRELDIAEWQIRSQIGFVPEQGRVHLVTVRGDSMYPDIKNGDVVMADTKRAFFDGDGLYLVNIGGLTFVKRLQMLTDGLHVISTNPKYRSQVIKHDETDTFHIGARVLGVALMRRAEEV